ncbi:unnamed protein product [Thlaspi arvense]|uniref:sucrose-phosphate synthase n=1 Tax=Thlaspi arvense TaxID=13288 RepID=A0AAU9S8C6_THLAR|nr:unnamed protein product [Thlaspi arvense]
MAGNDWINSYLEAILDVGPGIDDAKSSLLLRERGRFSPTRYFVEQVITGFDETDLHRSWVKVRCGDAEPAGKEHEAGEHVLADLEFGSPEEAVWSFDSYQSVRRLRLAREFETVSIVLEGEEAQRMTKRRIERERGRREATADMSEDLSEGEKGDTVSDLSAHGESNRGRLPRINSVETMEAWASQQKDKKLYIVLVRHELIRKVCCGASKGIRFDARSVSVDLLTRQVSSPDVDWSYGEPTEMLPPRNSDGFMNEMGESGGAYIIRIPFGPRDKYIPKELLWPHIPEFVDGALNHIIQMSKVLGEQIGGGHPVWPVAIHGHYADAGDAAALLSGALNVPMLFTGHSLGRDKLEQLLRQGRLSRDEINTTYKIMRRIEAEELSLDASEIVITSTRQEIEEQWRLYDGFDPVLERKLRARIRRNVSCYGRFMPRMAVIPPGMEFHHIVPHEGDMDGETEGSEDQPTSPDPPIWFETLIMGNRDDVDEMSGTNASVLLSILKLIDKYDLYGQVAYPKHHKQSDVPDIYRLAAKTKAAAHGLPIVATKNGGPVDIHRVLDNGLLVDPHDQQSIAGALLKLVADKQLWAKCRQNGLKNIHLFSWPEHCRTYLTRIASCKPRQPGWQRSDDGDDNSESDSPNRKSKLENAVLAWSKGVLKGTQKVGHTEKGDQNSNAGKFPTLRRRKHIIVIALDSDSISDIFESAGKIFDAMEKERSEGSVGFILATSFTLSEIQAFLVSSGISPTDFDAFICNSGGDLYYSSPTSEENPFVVDLYYHSHIEYRWGGEGLRKTLVRWAGSLVDRKSEKEEQIVTEDEKISTNYCYAFKVRNPGKVTPVKEIRKLMRIQALRCHIIYCQNGNKINVIPVLASRSQALRYLYLRWGMDLSKVVVFVGESGDTDYEGLLGGVHKSVILKGVSTGSSQLHANRSYPLSDVLSLDSPTVAPVTEECSSDDVRAALEKLGLLKC